MSRLILVTGSGGSGVSTLAAATAEAARAEGLTVREVSAGTRGPGRPDVAAVVATALGGPFAALGADPVVPEAWTGLPEVRLVSALGTAAEATAEVDLVVVDAGPIAAAIDLVGLPDALVRVLDAALTPRLAMARAADGSAVTFESLSAARAQAVRLRHVLQRPSTTVRLVVGPDPGAPGHVRQAIGAFALLGTGVDGVIVNRFPRKSDVGPAGARAVAADVLADVTSAAEGVEVWKSTSRVRAIPAGRSVLGPLGRIAVLDADQVTVHVGDEDLHLDLPLSGQARAEARVGIEGDRLVVAFDGCLRWLDLPPVLRRCQPLRAERTREGLRITFTPDPATWMQRPAEDAS